MYVVISKLENEKANLQKENASLQNQINIYEQTELKTHSSELIKQNEHLQESKIVFIFSFLLVNFFCCLNS